MEQTSKQKQIIENERGRIQSDISKISADICSMRNRNETINTLKSEVNKYNIFLFYNFIDN